MDEIFGELAGGEAEPLTLKVKGREVEIPSFRNGVGRAAFWDLCGRPLGPGDYLAVAEACRVLLLDGIPRLGSEQRGQAVRHPDRRALRGADAADRQRRGRA